MKGFLSLSLLFFVSVGIAQEKINWMSLEEAVEAQKKSPKKIVMDVYTKWCGPCKMYDKLTFHNGDVVKYVNKNFYAVKFNAEGPEKVNYKGRVYENPSYDSKYSNSRNSQHQLASYLVVNSYPTLIFMDERADPILPLTGFYRPKELEVYLKVIATGKYTEFKTDQDFLAYKKEFKSEFR